MEHILSSVATWVGVCATAMTMPGEAAVGTRFTVPNQLEWSRIGQSNLSQTLPLNQLQKMAHRECLLSLEILRSPSMNHSSFFFTEYVESLEKLFESSTFRFLKNKRSEQVYAQFHAQRQVPGSLARIWLALVTGLADGRKELMDRLTSFDEWMKVAKVVYADQEYIEIPERFIETSDKEEPLVLSWDEADDRAERWLEEIFGVHV